MGVTPVSCTREEQAGPASVEEIPSGVRVARPEPGSAPAHPLDEPGLLRDRAAR